MTTYTFGDVILVPFPFTDQSQAKQRPAVVVSSTRYNVERPDIPVFTTLDKRLVRKSLGRLQAADCAALRAAVQVILG